MISLIKQEWKANPSQKNTPGMLGFSETAMLYYLAKDYYKGYGEIIDLGAFIGASSFALSRGLRENCIAEKAGRIHAYDKFEANDKYLHDFIIKYVDKEFPTDGDFLSLYYKSVDGYNEYLNVNKGDFTTAKWLGHPVEILFIDIAKNTELNGTAIREFFPALMPGRSVVIHQDYHHPSLPFIHVTMEYLSDHFTIVNEKTDYSILYLNTSKIPAEKLKKAADYDFTPEEKLEYMNRAIAKISPAQRTNILLAKLILLLIEFKGEGATEEFLRMLETGELDINDKFWKYHAPLVTKRLKLGDMKIPGLD
ncbi:MAG: hypothetical protein AB7E96_04885 [Deferribacterales bacterium]